MTVHLLQMYTPVVSVLTVSMLTFEVYLGGIMFPLDRWYVAGFSWDLKDEPVARIFLGQHVVLFRTQDGTVGALEDRCCHRSLPLSCGKIEGQNLRCGYHGLLYGIDGACQEVPGQSFLPKKAGVRKYPIKEQDQILWIWMGTSSESQPDCAPPSYRWHSDARYEFRGSAYRYDAPYQLIHDNLLDLSHLGYVHLKTIGGNPTAHMNAQMKVDQVGNKVRVVRHLLNSAPPKTYTDAYPFRGRIDRWQEIEFEISHISIFTGAVDVGTESIDDPDRGGFHMRGFHGITPETETTAHYFWTMATNHIDSRPSNLDVVMDQTALTFDEDKVVVEAQWRNMREFGDAPQVDIHVDVGANRARRVIQRLCAENGSPKRQVTSPADGSSVVSESELVATPR